METDIQLTILLKTIYIDITCNTEEPQQKYRLGTVSNRLLEELNTFYWIQNSPSASAIVQPNQTITTNQPLA